jgi:hypothetical protein
MDSNTQTVSIDKETKAAKIQAFAHLSRLHASSSASFFTLFFAYLMYLAWVANNVLPHIKGYFILKTSVFLVVPAVVPVFQLVRYVITNAAFKRVAQEIEMMGTFPNLYSYICSVCGEHRFLGRFYLLVSQPIVNGRRNYISFFVWVTFIFVTIIFVLLFLYVFYGIADP